MADIDPSKMRVADLRRELKNNDLDSTGAKNVLVKRYANALKDGLVTPPAPAAEASDSSEDPSKGPSLRRSTRSSGRHVPVAEVEEDEEEPMVKSPKKAAKRSAEKPAPVAEPEAAAEPEKSTSSQEEAAEVDLDAAVSEPTPSKRAKRGSPVKRSPSRSPRKKAVPEVDVSEPEVAVPQPEVVVPEPEIVVQDSESDAVEKEGASVDEIDEVDETPPATPEETTLADPAVQSSEKEGATKIDAPIAESPQKADESKDVQSNASQSVAEVSSAVSEPAMQGAIANDTVTESSTVEEPMETGDKEPEPVDVGATEKTNGLMMNDTEELSDDGETTEVDVQEPKDKQVVSASKEPPCVDLAVPAVVEESELPSDPHTGEAEGGVEQVGVLKRENVDDLPVELETQGALDRVDDEDRDELASEFLRSTAETDAYAEPHVPALSTIEEEKPQVLRRPPVDPLDDSNVLLDTYTCDLNMKIGSKTQLVCQPITSEGFAFMWAGTRATYGVQKGCVGYEVKIMENLLVDHLPKEEVNPHLCRFGWSMEHSTTMLGETDYSFGYEGTGRSCERKIFERWSEEFGIGDNFNENSISFCKNGVLMGTPFKLVSPIKEEPSQQEEEVEKIFPMAIFPHVLVKNCRVSCNFGQKKAWHKLPAGYKFINRIPIEDRVRGALAPNEKKDSMAMMMMGLPGAGKTTWCEEYARDNPDSCWYILSSSRVLDLMRIQGIPRRKIYQGRWDVLIGTATKCLNKLLMLAPRKKRNYIIDQSNVYATARIRKMKGFLEFRRKAVVVVPTDEEYNERFRKQAQEEGKNMPPEAVLEMKANFKLPSITDGMFHEIFYVEQQFDEADGIVKQYNEEGMAYKLPAEEVAAEKARKRALEEMREEALMEQEQALQRAELPLDINLADLVDPVLLQGALQGLQSELQQSPAGWSRAYTGPTIHTYAAMARQGLGGVPIGTGSHMSGTRPTWQTNAYQNQYSSRGYDASKQWGGMGVQWTGQRQREPGPMGPPASSGSMMGPPGQMGPHGPMGPQWQGPPPMQGPSAMHGLPAQMQGSPGPSWRGPPQQWSPCPPPPQWPL